MATWRDFKAFVKSGFDIEQEETDMLQLLVDASGERSQVVYLWHRRLMKGTEDWLVIESPFAEVDDADLPAVLDRAGEMVCGGVVAIDGYVYFRHALPLENMDVNEFERPLRLVSLSADRLERLISGDDEF
jgi:hypothetical protein